MGASDPSIQKLLVDMLKDTEEHFLYWALESIVTWKNTTSLNNVHRIHGDRDKVLPLTKADYIIKNGGHTIVADRAGEVSSSIKKIID